jgi:hypothetical protein
MTPAPLPHFAVGASFSGLFGMVARIGCRLLLRARGRRGARGRTVDTGAQFSSEPAHGLLFEDRAKTLYGLVP